MADGEGGAILGEGGAISEEGGVSSGEMLLPVKAETDLTPDN